MISVGLALILSIATTGGRELLPSCELALPAFPFARPLPEIDDHNPHERGQADTDCLATAVQARNTKGLNCTDMTSPAGLGVSTIGKY